MRLRNKYPAYLTLVHVVPDVHPQSLLEAGTFKHELFSV